MDAPWRIQLFGQIQAHRGSLSVSRFATSRVAALLARLALFPRQTHPREELVELLWPDCDLAAGRLRLRVALASLRRQLEPPGVPAGSILIADRSSIHLHPPAFRSDVAEFRAAFEAAALASTARKKRMELDRAFALRQDELLPGFYDDWIVEERERLNALYEEVCAQRQELPEEKTADAPALQGFPLPFTRFFGRETECRDLAALLRSSQTRLLTLTGPGGAGKTRLACEIARHIAGSFSGPICFVPLADVNDGELICGAIADALALPRSPAAEPLEQIVAMLANQPPSLLVLDNFEQIVERGASVALSLLTRLPTLTCLITSRRRLNIPGEREWPVSPLSLPEQRESPEQVFQAASVRLFVDRAQAARPDFQLTPGNMAAVADLCRKLDGLPLAIELVAARALTLTPAQMAERLHPRTLPDRQTSQERHSSLWAALAWSYDLISPDLQRFFAGLCVFRGGFTAEAARFVCEEPQALEFLTQLRERSLLLVEEVGGEMRFRLLQTLREFAGEQLDETRFLSLQTRHGEHFLALAEEARPALRGAAQAHWLERLDADHDNFRAALESCRQQLEGVETELRLGSALAQFWAMRGHLREARGRLEDALARSGEADPLLRADALHGAGFLAYWQGDYPATQAYCLEALRLRRGLNDEVGTIRSLQMLANAFLYQGDYSKAKACFAEALAKARERADESECPTSLMGLAIIAHWHGEYEDTRALYSEGSRILEKLGDRRNLALALYNLGEMERGLGHLEDAKKHCEHSLALCREAGGGLVGVLQIALGNIALAQGQEDLAQTLLEDGLRVSRETGEEGDTAIALRGLGHAARLRGDHAAARLLLARSLNIHHAQGEKRQMGVTLEQCAAQALAESQGQRAARLMGLSQTLLESLQIRPTAAEQAESEQQIACIRAVTGPASYAEASEWGRSVTWDEAVTYAQGEDRN